MRMLINFGSAMSNRSIFRDISVISELGTKLLYQLYQYDTCYLRILARMYACAWHRLRAFAGGRARDFMQRACTNGGRRTSKTPRGYLQKGQGIQQRLLKIRTQYSP